jgi:hypothetical protein
MEKRILPFEKQGGSLMVRQQEVDLLSFETVRAVYKALGRQTPPPIA